MSVDILNIPYAANALNSVFPDENWELFLTKNMHGLTSGYSLIPFHDYANQINYELTDLQNFAIEYGMGKYSSSEVASLLNSHMKHLALGHSIDDLEEIIDPFESMSNFIKEKMINVDGPIDPRLEGLKDWMVAMKELTHETVITCQTLMSLACHFLSICQGNTISISKAAEIYEDTLDRAKKICDNAKRIHPIFNY